MPIYAYRCESCGHAKDVLQKLSDLILSVCPACGADTFRKQVTAAGFQLKGSGWYVTDFKGGATSVPPVKTDEPAKAVVATKAGKVNFKLDKNGNISSSIGKLSFDVIKLKENAEALIEAVYRAKPATAKGKYITSMHTTATMTPGLALDAAKYARN